MNNKAQTSIVAFMIAIVIIFIGLAFIPATNEITTKAMNTTSEVGGMDCANTADDFVKAACYVVDINQLLFIGGLIALAGVLIAAKIIFS